MEPPYLREHLKKRFPPEQTSLPPHESPGTGHYGEPRAPSSLPHTHPTHAETEASPTPELEVLLRNVKAELRCQTEWPFRTRLFPISTLRVQLKECLPPSSSPTRSCSIWTWTSPLDKQTPVLTGVFLAFKEFILMGFFLGFSVLPVSCTHYWLAFLFHLYRGWHII